MERRALTACSADARLLDLLAEPRIVARAASGDGPGALEVHSVFARTANLMLDGRMITLATAGLDDAPMTAILDGGPGALAGLVPGQRGRIPSPGVLELPSLTARLVGAARWEAWLPSLPPSARLGDSIELAAAAVRAARPLVQDPVPPGTGSPMARALSERARALLAALAARDPQRLEAAADRLVGLGDGLTPAGDDLLAGLALALALPRGDHGLGARERCALDSLAAAVTAGAERTGTISLAHLRHALAGRCRERVAQFLAAICAGGPTEISDTARGILSIGHSSGGDIASGILAGFSFHVSDLG